MTVVELPLWEILVPYKMGEHDNSDPSLPKRKRTIPVPYHQVWDDFVRKTTGGLTIHRAARGQWEDREGKLYKEIMIPVRIACTQDQIKQIAEFTVQHYKQKAVFVTLVSEKTLIFYADGEAPDPDQNQIVALAFFYRGSQGIGIGEYTADFTHEGLAHERRECPGVRFKPIYASDRGRWESEEVWTRAWYDELMSRPFVFDE